MQEFADTPVEKGFVLGDFLSQMESEKNKIEDFGFFSMIPHELRASSIKVPQ
eukprot:GAFH01004423.1.p4 GENE.GAFH01004423.1~~GAFH01004423.1.p4  ORF type:complete len:52 (+),score=7.21 GAFH01004423.1:363-518(+)